MRSFLLRIGLLMIVYSVVRFLFLFLNWQVFHKFSFSEIALSFVSGWRFDLAALLLINIPILFLSLLPWKHRHFLTLKHWLFVVLNLPFIFANLIDCEYFPFTGTRMTQDIFHLQGEATAQADQFLLNYWHLLIITIFIVAFVVYGSLFIKNRFPPRRLGGIKRPVLSFVLVGLAVVGARGGLQIQVLFPIAAYSSGATELGTLALNSSFTLLKSDANGSLKPVQYFESSTAVRDEIDVQSLKLREERRDSNVVILILESLATEFWGVSNEYKGYTPFLDSLARDENTLFFRNNFANARRSIEALPAILFGLPTLLDVPIVRSNYQASHILGLGTILAELGYHTSFFHGAAKGTMEFDTISKRAGLKDYYPLERYPDSRRDFDGHWGIFDEPILQYMVSELNSHSEPFLSVAFTISTHQPYQVPPQYKGRFPKGSLPIHESVGYVDYAVKKFFESASKQPWFENTLFIITADHTQMSASEHYNMPLGRYMVPLLFYQPRGELRAFGSRNDRVTQHADILPSVLDYLGVRSKRLAFGKSIFDTSKKGEAILYANKNYWLVQNDYFLQMNPETQYSQLFDYRKDLEQKNPIESPAAKISKERRLKALIQYHNNGLIQNNLLVE